MPIPVISIAQMREWERATWATGQTEAEVIRRVGQCLAREALRLTRPGDRILILAGKGNNGQDALAAREHLPDRRIDLLEIREPAADLARLDALLGSRPALIVDALFGIGLDRPLSQDWIKFIERINAAGTMVLAVDVPSGLNADTAETHGAAVEAAVTLTVGAPKIGLVETSASRFVGRLEAATDVGLVACPHRTELNWTLPGDLESFPPRRQVATHKGSHGHLAILGGSLGYHGAAVLAARGAQRAQPGLITLYTPESVYLPVAAQLQAVMVSPWKPTSDLTRPFTADLIGPGLAAPDVPEQMKAFTQHIWRESPRPVVVDASALAWLPTGPLAKDAVRVLTPHPGEAARLLNSTAEQVQGHRVRALRELSKKFGGAWVVLKGRQTLVGRGVGEIYVNGSGNPHLAQGGSGDVLAGFLAGWLAQPALQPDPLLAIRYAVWRHGAAADALQATRMGWTVEDLVAALGNLQSSGSGFPFVSGAQSSARMPTR